jgi:branched-chain amino acid transport system permease protein
MWVRLKQVAIVAPLLQPVLDDLAAVFDLEVAFRDPMVEDWGLENAVLPIGQQFLEVVAPIHSGTTAERYLDAQLSQAGLSAWEAALVTVIGASVAGALTYTVVIRPLRRAPALAKAVTTIGLMSALVGLASLFWSNSYLTVPSLLPNHSIHALNAAFGANNLWAVGITIALAAALWALYRFTTFGMATRAASENERGV